MIDSSGVLVVPRHEGGSLFLADLGVAARGHCVGFRGSLRLIAVTRTGIQQQRDIHAAGSHAGGQRLDGTALINFDSTVHGMAFQRNSGRNRSGAKGGSAFFLITDAMALGGRLLAESRRQNARRVAVHLGAERPGHADRNVHAAPALVVQTDVACRSRARRRTSGSSLPRAEARRRIPKYKAYRLTMLITKYLKDFVISGGIDPYADIIDGGRNTVKKQKQETEMGTTSQHGGGSGTNDVTPPRDNDGRLTIRTTVSGGQLSQWYGSSKAVACLMDSGCFAHVEGKVCLDEPKYVERQTTGNMRLTAYAKEHEEECFLQFEMGDDGKLHYVKLPESVADKKFHYADHISDDILKQIGLVSEIATMMLEAICNMGFGDALRELMSKRICDYSVGLLRSITGLDNNTINSMRNGTSLTKVNVVSACLGLHLPFPVSKNMLDIASIILELYKGAESARRENTYYRAFSFGPFLRSRLSSGYPQPAPPNFSQPSSQVGLSKGEVGIGSQIFLSRGLSKSPSERCQKGAKNSKIHLKIL